jgi:hypothetical protein
MRDHFGAALNPKTTARRNSGSIRCSHAKASSPSWIASDACSARNARPNLLQKFVLP